MNLQSTVSQFMKAKMVESDQESLSDMLLLSLASPTRKEVQRMKIHELMTQPVMEIDENVTVQESAETMGKAHVGALLVTKNGEDVGIVTERDIMSKVIAAGGSMEKTKTKEIMSTPIVTVDRNMDAEEAMKAMAKSKVRRILITDKGKIVGIFTTSDIIKMAQ